MKQVQVFFCFTKFPLSNSLTSEIYCHSWTFKLTTKRHIKSSTISKNSKPWLQLKATTKKIVSHNILGIKNL